MGILTDCLSAVIYEISHVCTQLSKRAIDVAIKWVLAHVGICGDDCATWLAKSGLLKHTIDFPLRLFVFKIIAFMKKAHNKQWQQSRTHSFQGRHFHCFYSVIFFQATFLGFSRGHQCLLSVDTR